MSANRIAPDGMPRFAASHLGLYCFALSHKNNARLNNLIGQERSSDRIDLYFIFQ